MRIPRIHVQQPLRPGIEVELPSQAAEHVARVLRLESGHALRLFNGDGAEWAAELRLVAKRSVTARVIEPALGVTRESPLAIKLGQGVARGEKMDWILQKATELGVTSIVPLITDRTEVRLDPERAERRLLHWRAVVASACEQCGRNVLPVVHEPIRLHSWAAALDETAGTRLALDPGGDVCPRDLAATAAMTLAVGPEGGLSEHDLATLSQAHFHGLRLGPRTLRTETAGLAAVAALQAIHGDL